MSDETAAPKSPRTGRRRRAGRRGGSRPEQAAAPAKAAPAKTAPAKAAEPGTAGVPTASGESAARVPRRRRSSRRGGKAKKVGNNVQYPGQVTNDTSVPRIAAPSRRGKRKRPLAAPRIGVGCVILRGDQILLVRERGRWSLPKGGLEAGELIQDGARRETYEETGLVIELRDLAFVVEFQAESWGHHLQFFYTGREVGGELSPKDPDRDVQEARFVPIRELREYIRFRPRLVSLETWLHERRPRHFVFDLDQEPAMLRRRRPGVGEVQRSAGVEPDDVDLD
ncbi:hypothetical protein GCM10017783_13670 [Deinococcus piscis]|uniref:Nudix hydrolase domain-containing protein n=1 Tax=Deinococcus piscis TaxID=394230 RepID=A0ABQ3K4B5_9DEIO|nr:NUDIX hydrolase [Deinococcus piscis]GHG02601.1 hypothetical protein GCM10017783_13670 [Deinococcus piscis]